MNMLIKRRQLINYKECYKNRFYIFRAFFTSASLKLAYNFWIPETKLKFKINTKTITIYLRRVLKFAGIRSKSTMQFFLYRDCKRDFKLPYLQTWVSFVISVISTWFLFVVKWCGLERNISLSQEQWT